MVIDRVVVFVGRLVYIHTTDTVCFIKPYRNPVYICTGSLQGFEMGDTVDTIIPFISAMRLQEIFEKKKKKAKIDKYDVVVIVSAVVVVLLMLLLVAVTVFVVVGVASVVVIVLLLLLLLLLSMFYAVAVVPLIKSNLQTIRF